MINNFKNLLMKSLFGLLAIVVVSVSANSLENSDNDELVWVSMGADAALYIQQHRAEKISLNIVSRQSLNTTEQSTAKGNTNNDVVIAQVKNSELATISQVMHEQFNRCGGFIFHSTEKTAEQYVTQATHATTASTKTRVDYTIDNAQTVEELIAQLQSSDMISTVNSLSNYNNRFYTTQDGADISMWLRDEWQSISSERDDISVSLFEHAAWPQSSVIATISGTTNENEIVIIGGHLDSINGSSPVTGRAPGADDNASGIAVITAALKAIVNSDYKPARTIKIIGYAAEEVGLRGSAEIAAQHRSNFLNVVGVSQFDMTGFAGTAGQDITFINDFTNAAQNEYLTQLIDAYLPEVTYGFDICGYGCSDHASWHNSGFRASFPFEARFNDSNSLIHSSGDSSFNSLHALKFAKLAVIYLAELAKGNTLDEPLSSTVQFAESEISVDEGQTASIEIQRSGDFTQALSIEFATEDGSAIAGTDYTGTAGTLTWEAGESSAKTISVTTENVDTSKSFSILLSNPSNNVEVGLTSRVTINIVAEAAPPPPPPVVEPETSSGGGTLTWYMLIILMLVRKKPQK